MKLEKEKTKLKTNRREVIMNRAEINKLEIEKINKIKIWFFKMTNKMENCSTN